jgi:endonuclease YncB( thermonuclease family)
VTSGLAARPQACGVAGTVALAAVLAVAALSSPAMAECGGAGIGAAEVAAALDARTLRLADGREVRLAGLAPVPAAPTALARFTGHRVTLRGDDAPDRYGRQTLVVVPDGSETSIQARLLAEGAALASGQMAEPGCAAELAGAEAAARAAGRGLWTGAVIKNAARPQDILAKLGQFAIVEGKVHSVRAAGATLYLNFGRRWTRDFAATIPARLAAGFAVDGFALASLTGRRVRVRGIVGRRGGPRIEVVRAGQIELVRESRQGGTGQRERR